MNHHHPVDLAVDALAVHRLTRLVTADTITEGPRRRTIVGMIEAKQGAPLDEEQRNAPDAAELVALTEDPPKLAVLITCRWCAGFWVAVAVGRARRYPWWPAVARVLATSSAATFLAGLEDD